MRKQKYLCVIPVFCCLCLYSYMLKLWGSISKSILGFTSTSLCLNFILKIIIYHHEFLSAPVTKLVLGYPAKEITQLPFALIYYCEALGTCVE